MNPLLRRSDSASERIVTSFQTLRAASEPARVNLTWPFWELAAKIGGPHSRVGVVLPLSVAYLRGPVARAGRKAVIDRRRLRSSASSIGRPTPCLATM